MCYALADTKRNVVNMKLQFLASRYKLSEIFNGILLIVVLFLAVMMFSPESDVLSGRARASDGDSLRLKSERIRLLGIDAPELDQTCRLNDGSEWPCGRRSKDFLVQILAKGEIQCTSDARDKYGRILATCWSDEGDIGASMVMAGMAVSYNDYGSEEALARRRKAGLWVGSFISPRAWRDGVREQNSPDGFLPWLLDVFLGK